jgi:hypothetical protein
MSDERWTEIEHDTASATTHFARAGQLASDPAFAAEDMAGYTVQMAFMHAMQSGHTSLENALTRILRLLGEALPTGESWHADLIQRVAAALTSRPAILPPDLAEAADETRRFRNRAVRTYDNFSPVRATPAIQAAARLAAGLSGAVAAFRDVIDAD